MSSDPPKASSDRRTADATPHAASLIQSLRDIGYSAETALADIIDNSITAGARKVEILSDATSAEPAVAVLDDGRGMTMAELVEAMRPGSKNPLDSRASGDLGRFGLGMKSASFSQCKRLTVATRKDGTTSAATWDLDEVSRTNKWEVEIHDDLSGIPWSDSLGAQGTLVVWRSLDRLSGGIESDHRKRAEHINRLLAEAERHIRLVFHRFMSEDRPPLEIALNGRRLEPLDPFGTRFPKHQADRPDRLELKNGFVEFQSFTLPHHKEIPPADWNDLGGPEGHLRTQGFFLMSASNFQIVNGGQTTASIHAARKLAPEQLKDVFVQMKLTVVPSEKAEDIVPLISQFANSQNKVNAADFFANHPFHVRIEEFSRRILAPSGDEGYRETKWFYERARGQFADERGRRSIGDRKKFDAEFPRSQFFTKTDLAKFENSYRCLPHEVSLGAQKNFGKLAQLVGADWEKKKDSYDEVWFKRLIAKAIIFRNLEKLVPQQEWYAGGYRANIVTYAFAKIVHDADQKQKLLDLDRVWALQRVPLNLERACLAAAQAANAVITNPPAGIRNMSEWAKKQACWADLAKRPVDYGKDFWDNLIDPAEAKAVTRTAKQARQLVSGIEAQREVVIQGAEYWNSLLAFGRSIRKLTDREQGILRACTQMPTRIPSEQQSLAALAIADKLEEFYPKDS